MAFWDRFKKKDKDSTTLAKKRASKSADAKEQKAPKVDDASPTSSRQGGTSKGSSSVSARSSQTDKEKDSKSKPEKKDSKRKKLKKKEPKKPEKKGKKSKKRKKIPAEKADKINRIIVQPKISEASMSQQVMGKYVFIVNPKANKSQVAQAVEDMYGVTVMNVHLMNYRPKSRSFRGYQGQMKGFKKAIVGLKQGDTIDLFKEVK